MQSCRDRVEKFRVSMVNNNTQYALKQLWDEWSPHKEITDASGGEYAYCPDLSFTLWTRVPRQDMVPKKDALLLQY